MGQIGNRRAVVVGAGIAGLATALRLRRDGWDVLVIERAAARRSSGYLVNLTGYGYDAAERLGLLPALTARDIGWFTTVLVREDGGTKLTVPPALAQAALGARALTLFRGDLETVLYEAIRDEVPIRFGATVVDIVQDGTQVDATLDDGTVERAELLVGADGLHSGVRDLIFGSAAGDRVDLRHMVAAFPLARQPGVVPEGAGATFIGLRRSASVMNLGPDRSSTFLTYRTDDAGTDLAAGPVAALTAMFGDLGGGVPDALAQLAADPSSAYFDSVTQVVLPQWSRGRVVLLGDAAWCVTPFAGYGAALALTGADRLGAALGNADIPTALAEWANGLRPEVDKRQALARRGAVQYAPPTKAHVVMNEVMLRAIQWPVISGMVRRSVRRANK
ncbi:FAD-dependent oxidoreductase [Nocardia panacis]|uniref:FAD-dependent oxidoreductase n=1 Tax=Nocardia panacis TaxID=2340916 RepID=A0A3A4KDG7_9NOCA|nr:FAD-dependent oxidoreductase [Nocardia panacis]RJO70915.1 FAD-dependent oxidoreductase [Nocardia panacis]